MDYLKSGLFKDIAYDEYESMMTCFKPVKKKFSKGETIQEYDCGQDRIGIVQHGQVSIVRMDENGNRSILENINENSVFGDVLSFYGSDKDSVIAVCTKDCEIMFIDFYHITKRCSKACRHHSILVQNMFNLIVERAMDLSERVDILSQRTTKEKLLCYFRSCASPAGEFTLPFSLSALAEYLSVDRSAMMREIKKMKVEGIIEQNGRRIKLIKS